MRLNLRIKTTTVSFVNGDCTTHRQMEQLNSDIRNYLEKMRRTLERLRHLAERQSSSESRKMLLSDVDKYADQLAACHRSFRQANLRYYYAHKINSVAISIYNQNIFIYSNVLFRLGVLAN